jgi:hypothetical protein
MKLYLIMINQLRIKQVKGSLAQWLEHLSSTQQPQVRLPVGGN